MASISDQNWIVWNQGKNPLVNFNFMLRVEMLFDLPCKSVRAFTRELEYDYIQEGGLNDYVHMRRKPITQPFTLEIERYVGVDYLDPLPLGADLVLPVLLFVSRNHDQFIPGVVARTYVFTGCTVMKKTYGDLVADQSGLLVETTTIGYREMLCVDLPWSEAGDNISKDIQTPPTNAKSVDQTPSQLKALAQELYSQALAAKTQADTELVQGDVEALLQELEQTLGSLRSAVGAGGALTQQLDQAKAGLNGEGGKTKKALADEALDAARMAEQEAKERERAWREADAAWHEASSKGSELQNKLQDAGEKPNDPESPQETAQQTAAQDEQAVGAEQLKTAQAEEKDAKSQADQARKAYDAAVEEWKKAAAEAEKARQAQEQAQRMLGEAQSAFQTASNQINPLQNSLTNLKLRKDTGKQAQTDCSDQHDKCLQANTALQALGEDDLPQINAGFEQVKKLSKQTCYHEKQVREVCQHMQAARKLLSEVVEIPQAGQ